MEIIFSAVGIGITCFVVNELSVKAGKDYIGKIVDLAGVTVIIFMVIGKVGEVFDMLNSTFGRWL